MSRKTLTSLEEQMKKGQIIAPFVFDCMSARMAELTGFETFVLSSSALAMAYAGVPDMGILSSDDVISATARVSDFLPYPVIAEFENGFGGTPYIVWRNVRRLIRGEAAGVIIDDTTGTRGTSRMLDAGKARCAVVPSEVFYSKIRAAVDACKGTGCMVVAASNAKYDSGLDESIKRVKECKELGADIVMCRGIKSIEECRAIAAEVEGPKMYYEFSTTDGKPDVDLDEIGKLGFGIVTVRYLEKAALFGLMRYGLRCKADNNLVYVDYHDFDGLLPEMDHHIRLSSQWADLTKKIKDLSALDQ